jgi:hypothetical protein
LTRPTKRGVWQITTVILLAAATAGVVAINDLTQSPRAVAPAIAATSSPQLVGEEGGASKSLSGTSATAPSWLVKTAAAALSAKRDTTPATAYWGYAAASEDAWGLLEAAGPGSAYYWLVFRGDFQSIPASGGEVTRGHWLVVAVDAADHAVAASSLSAQAVVDPTTLSWLHPLHLAAAGE